MSSEHILSKVAQFIEDHTLLSLSDSVLVAISGGPDSVMLAWTLKTLGYSIGLAHVNYQLRGEDSAREEALVRSYGEKWNVPVFASQVDTQLQWQRQKASLQMFARQVRYEFFDQILENESFTYCATAHHADDQVESLLLSLFKGNSFSVFNPIPIRRGPYIRPLLTLTKGDIKTVLEEENLEFGLDYTNDENTYQRNKIRNTLIPEIQEVNPNFNRHILHRNAWYQRKVGMLKILLEKLYAGYAESGTFQNICKLEEFQQSEFGQFQDVFLGYCLMKWGLHGHLFQEGMNLIESGSGKKIQVDEDHTLYRTRYGVVLDKASLDVGGSIELQGEADLPWERKLNRQIIYVIKNNTVKGEFDPGLLSIDASKVFYPLVFRSWKEGDKMVPLGMKHPKKLSDIFIDEKYSPVEKKRAIVVESGGEIIAISGFRIADQVKVDFRTQSLLEIRFQPEGAETEVR